MKVGWKIFVYMLWLGWKTACLYILIIIGLIIIMTFIVIVITIKVVVYVPSQCWHKFQKANYIGFHAFVFPIIADICNLSKIITVWKRKFTLQIL
jgi:hypothetical protein